MGHVHLDHQSVGSRTSSPIRRIASGVWPRAEDGLFIDVQGSGDLANFLKDSLGRSSEYTSSGELAASRASITPIMPRSFERSRARSDRRRSRSNTGDVQFRSRLRGRRRSGCDAHGEGKQPAVEHGLPATWSWIDKLLSASASVNFVDALDYSDMNGVATKIGRKRRQRLSSNQDDRARELLHGRPQLARQAAASAGE